MIFFFNSDGTLFRSVPENVYQGSNNVNKLYVVAPFASSSAVTVAFRLPNGKVTTPALCKLEGATGELQGYIDEYSQLGLYVWSLSIPNWVTNYAGNVTAQFRVVGSDNTLLATSSAQFPVIQGVAPTTPATADLSSILSQFSALLAAWQEFQEEINATVAGYYERNAIIAVMTVESPNLTVQLGTGTLTLDRIEWGDGTTDTEFSHTYTAAGTYIVKIYATAWTYNDDADKGVFDECVALDAVYLPDNLPAIPDYAFYGCTYLKKIEFANNTSIGQGAFQNISAPDTPELTSIDLPNTIESIGASAFSLSGVSKVFYKGTKTEFDAISGLSGAGFDTSVKFYYLDDGIETQNAADIATIKSYIPSGTSASNQLQNASQVSATASAETADIRAVIPSGTTSENKLQNASQVAATIADTPYLSTEKTTAQTIVSDLTIGTAGTPKDVVITGDLTVQGTTTTEDVHTVQSENTLIVTNYSDSGSTPTGYTGVVAIIGTKDGSGNYPAMAVGVYDPTTLTHDSLKLGRGTYKNGVFTSGGSMQSLATRSDSIPNGSVPKWNGSQYTFDDSGLAYNNIVTKSGNNNFTGLNSFLVDNAADYFVIQGQEAWDSLSYKMESGGTGSDDAIVTIEYDNAYSGASYTWTFPKATGTLAYSSSGDNANVDTALSGKVDKTTTAYKVYGTNSSGAQTLYNLAYTPIAADAIVLTSSNGRVHVGTPTADNDATTKLYVDSNLPTLQDWTV